MSVEIENIRLDFLKIDDYEELKVVMSESYTNLNNSYWGFNHIESLINRFPEGQVVLRVNENIVACALSIIVTEELLETHKTYKDVTDHYSFDTHTKAGSVLYGIDVFVKPDFRGLRLGHRLYNYRKDLCEKLNLRAIAFGGRIPNYLQYADKMSAKEYIENVRNKVIHDPVLNFQLSNNFRPVKILKGYLPGDEASKEFAVLLQWDNIYYENPTEKADIVKRVIRLGLIQWQMRPYKDLDELMQQAEYFVNGVSGYRSDFVLFPEFFNAPLMAKDNDMSESKAIRELAKYTAPIVQRFTEMAISHNINIIAGSMPEIRDGKLLNVGYLCHRNGKVDRYEKIHITPSEVDAWGMVGGNQIQSFDTDCGKIGILICYDVEFPELSRLLAEQGMDILFVPFLTDTQNGFSRVRLCAQARAVENECYVAIAGSVGNLPKVSNMDIQYAQSMVCTPSDFAFPATGIKAETTPNTEMILIADVDIDLLRQLNRFGSVRNLRDRRKDLYNVELKS